MDDLDDSHDHVTRPLCSGPRQHLSSWRPLSNLWSYLIPSTSASAAPRDAPMTPHALIPWSRDKGEDEDEAGGGAAGWRHPILASPRPTHHPPQNHIYFALTRWAVLSCWSVWRQTGPRRKDRHLLTPADRKGGRRLHHAMTHPSEARRSCKTEQSVSNGSERVDCVGVSDSQAAAAGRVRASGASVSREEVAAPRWLTPGAARGSRDTSGRGSWSPPPPVCTNQKRTSPTPPPAARCAHSPAMLKMGASPVLVWVLLLALACGGGRVGVVASEFPDRECCDSAPPPPPHYHTTTSTTPGPLVRTLSTSSTPPPPSYFPIASIPPTGKLPHT